LDFNIEDIIFKAALISTIMFSDFFNLVLASSQFLRVLSAVFSFFIFYYIEKMNFQKISFNS